MSRLHSGPLRVLRLPHLLAATQAATKRARAVATSSRWVHHLCPNRDLRRVGARTSPAKTAHCPPSDDTRRLLIARRMASAPPRAATTRPRRHAHGRPRGDGRLWSPPLRAISSSEGPQWPATPRDATEGASPAPECCRESISSPSSEPGRRHSAARRGPRQRRPRTAPLDFCVRRRTCGFNGEGKFGALAPHFCI